MKNPPTKNPTKRILRPIAALTAALLLIITPLWVIPSLKKPMTFGELPESKYKGVYTLWHVENFEGGSVSREAYLKACTLALEKNEPNYFVLVRTVNEDTLNALLAEGQKPDMISFGGGLGVTLSEYLQEIHSANEIRSVYNASSQKDGAYLAVPYMAGGYALIGNAELLRGAGVSDEVPLSSAIDTSGNAKSASVVIGKNKHINPSGAFASGSDKVLGQYEAYEYFVTKRAAMLLGTQRDLNRLNMREELGRGIACRIEYSDSYTDLVQYIGIMTNDAARREACALLASYLASAKTQRSLASYGMFPTTDITVYTGGTLAQMESALKSTALRVKNIFE